VNGCRLELLGMEVDAEILGVIGMLARLGVDKRPEERWPLLV
jgi:hypothetical protein